MNTLQKNNNETRIMAASLRATTLEADVDRLNVRRSQNKPASIVILISDGQ